MIDGWGVSREITLRWMSLDLTDDKSQCFFPLSGHILDDKDLVETLQKSKGMSEEIHNRVSQSEEAEKKLNIARKRYLPVSP